MKNLFSFLFFFVFCLATAQAKCNNHQMADSTTVVDLAFHLNKDVHTDKDPFPHTPVRMPSVTQEDHTLTFNHGCDNTTLAIIDDEDETVYCADIELGCESLILPSWLTGVYKLQIIRGSFTFEAEIEL